MIYYTIYLKQLNSDTGYIDLGLEDDQLFKDFLTFLDIGMKSHRTYPLSNPATPKAMPACSPSTSPPSPPSPPRRRFPTGPARGRPARARPDAVS